MKTLSTPQNSELNEVIDNLLVGMPDEFFRMERREQDELWKAVLRKINDGIRETEKLAMFAEEWIRLYRFFGETRIVA
jgi:hypothetical protein